MNLSIGLARTPDRQEPAHTDKGGKHMLSRKKVGLVLGSGSSRGWAHIGAIEALEESQVPIDFIVGCSVGSYVGALYACGSLKSLKEFVLRMNGRKVFSYFDVVFPRSGLLDGSRKVKELFSMHTSVERFEDLKLPVAMVATDLKRGYKVVLASGDIMKALQATMSIPGLFAPVRIGTRWLVDGGLIDPVPVGVAKAMAADVVIAVDLNSGLISRRVVHKQAQLAEKTAPEETLSQEPEYKHELLKKIYDYYDSAEASFRTKINELFSREEEIPDIIDTVLTSINIMQERITRVNLAVEPPDILVQPRLADLKMMDFDRVDYTIEEGYLGMMERIEDIKALLATT
jgi:NTE family protein